MAAYGAVISLKNTINRTLQSSRISLVPASSTQVLRPAYEAMDRLLTALSKLDDTGYSKIRTKVNALDDRIKEAVWEFEDLLESHLYDQILPQLESEIDHVSFSVDLLSLQPSVDCFVKRMTEMELEYDIEVVNMPEEEGQPIASRIDFGGICSNMVGLSDEFEQLRGWLLAEKKENCLSITGMAGVGKTTLAKKIFDDPLIQGHFVLRAWVKVGRKCAPNDVLRGVLAQVDPNTQDQMFTQGDDDDDLKLVGVLEDILKDKKCLIVLDDVWVWHTQLMGILPNKNVRILLTSRLRIKDFPNQVVRLLNEEESKKLLCEKVFGKEGFPLSLEKLGEKIIKKCEGLPLMIVIVAELLSEDKTPEYWTEVATKQHNSVFVDAYNQISEVFFPSYEYLPQYLKMFFLYMGSFPPYCDIEIGDLIRRLRAEGFLESTEERTLEEFMVNCWKILAHCRNLVMYESNVESWFSKGEFQVHSCWQHVCKKEASKIKFLHVLQSCDDVMKGQRRLCTHHNTLFAFKEVYNSINSTCASTARSLLCLGRFHQYPVPIHDMDFKLLRVLDAQQVRFYHIPPFIMKLVCLNYLALACNGEIPNFISNLFHLQSLTIHTHINIKKRGAPLYVPLVIWDMQELQHISILGRDLPTPKSDATLDKLVSLFGISPKSCIRENLKRIPNLRMLEIMTELKPYDDDDDINLLSGLDYISKELQYLQLLIYEVTNPNMKYQSIVPLSMFPSSLIRLDLSGLGCPWKHMNDIGSLLPKLKYLKLRHYAFHGPEWNIESGCFLKLETLVIEDTDLMLLRPQHGSLPKLELLSIRHCYKLQQVDWTCDPSMVTKPTIELVECSPTVEMRPHFIVRCHSTI